MPPPPVKPSYGYVYFSAGAMLRWWVFVLAVVMVTEVAGQQRCTEQRTCGECIQTPGCRWCSMFTEPSVRTPTDLSRHVSNLFIYAEDRIVYRNTFEDLSLGLDLRSGSKKSANWQSYTRGQTSNHSFFNQFMNNVIFTSVT